MACQREVRLGLVLYGGVSLAVYENGVAQELYRAIRGDGVYGLLAKLIDSDIVVDIISGTSAGGINGVMLAYALANKKAFAPSADLWRSDGDISKLLRVPRDPNGSSILNSDYFQARLMNCFAEALVDDLNAPDIEELDLFVTSTDANGVISTVYDELGHAIDIKNHRALFKLEYRGERKNNFKVAPADLAKLSRMTSCFPVAFEPVRVTEDETNFFAWGKLRAPAVYLDGGLLNNKPFTSTIDAIESRTATREVERFLIYVEPKPEQFVNSIAVPPSPSVVQAALASLISIPGYQSIAGDLLAIEEHNERAARIVEILKALPSAPESTPECLQVPGIVPGQDDECDPSAYLAARSIQIRDAAVKGILDDANGRGYFPPKSDSASDDNRRSGRLLVQSFDAWRGSGKIDLQRYDVFYRMRRAIHLLNTLMREVKKNTVVPSEVWGAVNHCFKLYEIAKWGMTRWVQCYDFNWQTLSSDYPNLDTQPKALQHDALMTISTKVWGQVVTRLDEFLFCVIPVPIERTADAREAFHQEIVELLNGDSTGGTGDTNLLDRIDDVLKEALAALVHAPSTEVKSIASTLRDEFCRFLTVDQQLFLVQVGSGFESTETIRVVRFSPLDAQRCLSAGNVENKVRGIALSSFGGFFKKSWRANDIMMGRLDAACLLVECLLTKERLAALGPKHLVIAPAELRKYFKNPDLDSNAIAKTINDYLAAPNTATDQQWSGLINKIVCACHNDIQAEEWPSVIACAIQQEYEWSQYRENTKTPEEPYDPKKLVWNRAKAKPDEVLMQVARDAIAAKKIPPFAPGLEESERFLDEIPESVLEELGALAMIRLGKGLLASIPDNDVRCRVQGSLLYKYPFKWIAPIIYRWARIRRTQPAAVIVLNTFIPAFCIAAWMVDSTLWVLGVHPGIPVWAVLILVPLALLYVWGRFLRR